MKRDSRLSLTLHALVHLADGEGAVTSEAMAAQTGTNPVVVRRTFAGLREAGLVTSVKGHGGGWSLARPAHRITLGDLHDALGAPAVFAMEHRSARPECLVEQAVNRAMAGALAEAERALVRQFRSITLADIAADVRRRARGRKTHDVRRDHHRR